MPSSILAVVDTNVFVAALLSGATPRKVYDAFLDGRLTPVFSPETLAELIDVLTRPTLRVLMSEAEIARFLTMAQRDGRLVRPTTRITACRDLKDNMLLDAALAGPADVLVTGDKDLLVLHPFRGIRILRPAEFLPLLP